MNQETLVLLTGILLFTLFHWFFMIKKGISLMICKCWSVNYQIWDWLIIVFMLVR